MVSVTLTSLYSTYHKNPLIVLTKNTNEIICIYCTHSSMYRSCVYDLENAIATVLCKDVVDSD